MENEDKHEIIFINYKERRILIDSDFYDDINPDYRATCTEYVKKIVHSHKVLSLEYEYKEIIDSLDAEIAQLKELLRGEEKEKEVKQ